MSLTEAQTVFAGIHEDAINDVLTAFCTDRPRYLVYGSPAFVPATTVAETTMPAIAFPGVPGGIQWRLRLTIPRVDLFKPNGPLPPPLVLGPGQFSAQIGAELCIDCRRIRIDPKPPRPTDPRKDGPNNPNGNPKGDQPAGDTHPLSELTCFKLELFVLGHIEHVLASTGDDAIAFAVDAVEIVDITPDELESFLECLMFMILQAVLAGIRLPLKALRAGAFQLALTVGPLIEDDQVKVRGIV
jgi:hypothetical protein